MRRRQANWISFCLISLLVNDSCVLNWCSSDHGHLEAPWRQSATLPVAVFSSAVARQQLRLRSSSRWLCAVFRKWRFKRLSFQTDNVTARINNHDVNAQKTTRIRSGQIRWIYSYIPSNDLFLVFTLFALILSHPTNQNIKVFCLIYLLGSPMFERSIRWKQRD